MADNLPPLPNPGDADYPTDPILQSAVEQERARRKKAASRKETQKKLPKQRGPKAKNLEAKPKKEQSPADAAEAQKNKERLTRPRGSKGTESTLAIKKKVDSAVKAYGQNPTTENKAAYDKAVADYKKATGKDYVPAGTTKPTTKPTVTGGTTAPWGAPKGAVGIDYAPGTKGFVATGAALKNTGAAFTPETVAAVWGGTAGQKSTTGATSTQGMSGSGYGSFSGGASTTGAASPFVTVPIQTTKTQGYSQYTYTTPTTGMAHMTSDAAYQRFIKSLTSGTPEAQSIVNQMIKSGLVKKNTSDQQIASIYKDALDWTAQAIASGTTGYTVSDAIASLGKAYRAGGGGGGTPKDTTNVSYQKKIYTEDEVRSVGNAVAQNLLGRMLTDDEIAQQLHFVNSESKKAPQKTVTKTHYSGTKSTSRSTTSGGYDAQAGLEQQLGQTVESQAYTTNNLFNSAMQVLASRIG